MLIPETAARNRDRSALYLGAAGGYVLPFIFLALKLARKRVLSDKRCRACSHVASSTLLTDSDTELTCVSDPGEAVGISDEDEPDPATAAPSADQATVVIHTASVPASPDSTT
jgi:hypothetical protein